MCLGLAAAIAIAFTGLVEMSVQGAAEQQQQSAEFFVYGMPRLARATQKLLSQSQSVVVYDAQGGSPSASGPVLQATMNDPASGQTVDTWLCYDATKKSLQYINGAGNTWYLGGGEIGALTFTMNDDGTVTMFVQSSKGIGYHPGMEVVLNRQ